MFLLEYLFVSVTDHLVWSWLAVLLLVIYIYIWNLLLLSINRILISGLIETSSPRFSCGLCSGNMRQLCRGVPVLMCGLQPYWNHRWIWSFSYEVVYFRGCFSFIYLNSCLYPALINIFLYSMAGFLLKYSLVGLYLVKLRFYWFL